jgi:hypothetical protein
VLLLVAAAAAVPAPTPDFAEARMESRPRKVNTALVVIIGWLYLLPQLGCRLTLRILTGAPDWVGSGRCRGRTLPSSPVACGR